MNPSVCVLCLLVLVGCHVSEVSLERAPTHDAGQPWEPEEPLEAGADVEAPEPDAHSPDRDAGEPEPRRPLDLRLSGGFVRKVQALAGGGLLMTIEAPLSLRVDAGRPRRELRWLSAQGEVERSFSLPAGRELLDSAVHTSGAVSILAASDDGYAVLQLDAQGRLRTDLPLIDESVALDPPKLPPGAPSEPIGYVTHDTGRIAALGEDVIIATRTGRHSVLAYRFAFGADGATLMRKYRTLVEPAASLYPIGLTGGTYDTFSQVEAQYTVHLAVAEDGLAYVGVRYPELATDRFAKLHKELFGEILVGDPDYLDIYVTRVASDGTRLGTSVVTTPQQDELYGLRAFAGAAYAVGRNEYWNEQGTGHQALVARIDALTGAVSVRDLDVERGDIAFDVLELSNGALLVVGASGYWQNPHGASISEECNTFARILSADGSSIALPLPNGPRHSELRTLLEIDRGYVLFGGMLDGPGTHSADADPALLRASGFLVAMPLPQDY